MLSVANNTPSISIIMPAYNSRSTIGESIQSVVNQTFSDWELLIIDDCSPESMKDIAESFHDERIRYIRLLKNSGVVAARNTGIVQAKGRYIAFLDSDDLWLPEKLEKQIQFMEKHHYAFTYTWYRQFTTVPSQPIRLVKTKASVDYQSLLYGNDIGCLTVVIDRQQIPEIEMPRQYHEDYITWLNILRQGGKAYSLPMDLARYRVSKGSVSGDKKKSFFGTWHVYRDSQNLSIMKSLYCSLYYVAKGIKKHFL